MENTQVAHLWANKSRDTASGSHFYFEGDTIYSYGSHFPIARHYKGVVLFTTKVYSNTTARHISMTRQACSHLQVFEVSDVLRDPCGADVKEYKKHVEWVSAKVANARHPDLERIERVVNQANSFCEKFGFSTRFSMPDESTLATLKERAKLASLRDRKAKAKRLAKEAAETAEKVSKWLSGEAVSLPYTVQKVYLRARFGRLAHMDKADEHGVNFMETSKGATVPLSEAEKAFRFVMLKRAKGWHRNGDQFQIGEFQLEAVNEQGVVAGCHRIAWDEIERFAKAQGWL